MNILYENNNTVSPKVSIILLDWSCRESFHSLDYLNKQTIRRQRYEIIWIEYYSRRSKEIEDLLKESKEAGRPPALDKWIVMDMPDDVYYHKHLMYNIGIVASRGEIGIVCDSDAIFRPTFVESIIKAFEEDRNIVLHLDEVRSVSNKFYPFNYPAIDEILNESCINWENGKTTGLLDKEDPLHTLNYGACMCALREDLIGIGGADEHIDYLGHICGPYEMTFRLINAGKKEVWHHEEFLYHAWHPGTDGKNNHLGPHDGRNMSTIALEARKTGRVMPLVENPAVKILRLKQDDIVYEPLILQAIPDEDIKNWEIRKLNKDRRSVWIKGGFMKHPVVNFQLAMIFLKLLGGQLHMKVTKFSRKPSSIKYILKKIYRAYDFLKNMAEFNAYIMEKCNNCLEELIVADIKEVAVYGTGSVAEIFYKVTSLNPWVKIKAVYDDLEGKKFFKFKVMPVEAIRNYAGTVVVADVITAERKVEALKNIGVEGDKIKVL